MITEWFFNLSSSFNVWLAGLVPAPPETVVLDGWAQLMLTVSGAGAWINVPAMVGLCAIACSWYVAALFVKLLRVLASHVPFIGGRG